MNEEYIKHCQAAYQRILAAKNILIVSHLHPDVDAMSSLGIIIEIVEGLDKGYLAYAQDKDEGIFDFLPHSERIHGQLPVGFSLGDYDLAVVLDCGSVNRTGLAEGLRQRDKKKLQVIEFDHHPKVDDYADLEIRLPQLASTTEVLYHFLQINEVSPNKNLANLLLAGILTDTGNFLYPSTSESAVNIASEMLEHGAQLPKIVQNTVQNKNLAAMKLWGLAMDNLQINKKYNLAVSVLTKKEMSLITGIDTNNDVFGDIVGFLSNLGGVKGVILLREENDGRLKANLRTADPEIDLSQLAQVFGGGGHAKASGFLVKGKIKRQGQSWRFQFE